MNNDPVIREVESGKDIDEEFEGDTFEPSYVTAGALPRFGKLPRIPFSVKPYANTPRGRGVDVYVWVCGDETDKGA